MKRDNGFTYIEVMVSMVILLLLIQMMWTGFKVSQRLVRTSQQLVEASHYSEEMMHHIARQVKNNKPVEHTEDLIAYLSIADSTQEAIGTMYGMTHYDYYVVMIDKSHWKSTDKLSPQQLDTARILSTVTDTTKRTVIQTMVEEMIRTSQVKLLLTYDTSLNPAVQQTLTDTLHIDGKTLTLEKEVTAEALKLTVTSSQLPSAAERKQYEKMPVYIPVDTITDAVGLRSHQVYLTNRTSFPIIIEDREEGGRLDIVVPESPLDSGHISYSYREAETRTSWVALCIVLRKGGSQWTDILKKQLAVM